MFEFINCHGTFILFWIEDGKAWAGCTKLGHDRVWRHSYRPYFVPSFEAGFPKEEQRRIWEIFNPEKVFQSRDGSWRRVADKLSSSKDELWFIGETHTLVRLYERGTKMVCTNPCGEAWRPTEADQREAIQALAPEWLNDGLFHTTAEELGVRVPEAFQRSLDSAIVQYAQIDTEQALMLMPEPLERSSLEPDIHWSFRAPVEKLDIPRILREAREQGANEVLINCPGLKPMLSVHESVIGLLREFAVATSHTYEEVCTDDEWTWLRDSEPLLAKARKWRASQKKLEYRRTTVVGTK